MLSPRWKKVLADLWTNPSRTILVVLSIFIGVFAVGTVVGTETIVVREMNTQYLNANPANATISVPDEDSFDEDLIQAIRNTDGVGEAEGRRTFSARVQGEATDWNDITVVAIEDFDDIQIDRVTPLRGATTPPDKELLIERSGMALVNKQVGDIVTIERPDGKQRQMRIAGEVYDPTQAPARWGGVRAYVTRDTMEWLSGESADFNQVVILVAENRTDIEHNEAIAETVYDKIQKSGRDPSFPQVSDGKHPLNTFISAMVAILGVMGVVSVLLSGFLVTNTISALLAQQIKQIGIMKSIGARSLQILGMYLLLVSSFGLLALLLAYPLATLSSQSFSQAIAGFFNFNLADLSVPLTVPLLQIAISLFVPLLAALYPVISGTRVTVREALSSEGGQSGFGNGPLDRLIRRVRGLPRPILLSLRNTFRRKGRVTLTLLTLMLGGAIFISIFSIRNSLRLTLDNVIASLFNYDVQVDFDRSYRDEWVVNEALRVPGVAEVEAWNISGTRRILPNGNESETITLWGVPPESQMVQPTIIEGRWLLPEDQNAVVLSSGIFQEEPDIQIGDEIVLRIRDRDIAWRVVGKAVTIGAVRWAYVDDAAYGRAAQEVGSVATLIVRTQPRDAATQQRVADTLDTHLSSLGINVVGTDTGARVRADNEAFFNVIITVLLAMAVLMAVVGGLGLAGTMSLNVLERIREIGVMRAIGASDNAVLQVVIVEGIVIGFLSWLFGAAISFPASWLFSQQVGTLLFTFPLDFSFSIQGAVIWLVLSIVLAGIASFVPAWNASRVTVRDVLAYE